METANEKKGAHETKKKKKEINLPKTLKLFGPP